MHTVETQTTARAASLMLNLRDSTADLHREAENHPFQKALATGKLDRELYVRYLQRMLQIHRALEAGLRGLMETDVRVAGVVYEEQFQEENLLLDLAHFGQAGAVSDPASAVATVAAYENEVARLVAERNVGLLGHHYVLEGSKNGAKFIAHAVRGAYRLTPGSGDRFLDPYGAEQRSKWMSFKASMDAVSFTPDEQCDILSGASDMFRTIINLAAELAGEASRGPGRADQSSSEIR